MRVNGLRVTLVILVYTFVTFLQPLTSMSLECMDLA